MCFGPVLFGNCFLQPCLYFERSFALGKPQTVADPKDVGIYRDCIAAERYRINDVRRFFTDAGKAHQLFYRLGATESGKVIFISRSDDYG